MWVNVVRDNGWRLDASAEHAPENDDDSSAKHGEADDFQAVANRPRVGDGRWGGARSWSRFGARTAGHENSGHGQQQESFHTLPC